MIKQTQSNCYLQWEPRNGGVGLHILTFTQDAIYCSSECHCRRFLYLHVLNLGVPHVTHHDCCLQSSEIVSKLNFSKSVIDQSTLEQVFFLIVVLFCFLFVCLFVCLEFKAVSVYVLAKIFGVKIFNSSTAKF